MSVTLAGTAFLIRLVYNMSTCTGREKHGGCVTCANLRALRRVSRVIIVEMRDKEQKLDEVETSHTLGGAGEGGGIQGEGSGEEARGL